MNEKEPLGILRSGKRWLLARISGAGRRAFSEHFDRIESRLDEGEQRLQRTIDARALQTQAAVAAEAAALQELAAGQRALEQRLGSTEHSLAQQAAQAAQTRDGLAQRVDRLDEALAVRLGDAGQRVDRLEEALTARLDGLEQAQATGLGRLDGLAGRADGAPALIAAHAEQTRRMQAQQVLWNQLARIPDLQLTGPARNVLFLHNSYYHFYYLARALRRRGWRALSVSIEDPNGVNAHYYHGEDINLHDADPLQRAANIEALYAFAKSHFDLMHFAGDGIMSFFPANFGLADPPDIVDWKQLGKRLAYTISGCNSATAQSSVAAWSRQQNGLSMCDNCPWQGRPEVCSDERNLAWGVQVNRYCDLVFSELQPSLDYLSSRHVNVVRGPVTMVVDEEFWRPDLPIPAPFVVAREPGEVLVYHAFGNYDARGMDGRNIKGTPAIVAAVERLRAEGLPVRLMFLTNVPNETVRYYQAQADIVVDQLWAGSWGANGRESMMLGKPVVGFLHVSEQDPADILEAIATSPIVNATVDTIYAVLKDLVQDPARRAALGARSREYALAWHSATAGAARYELAYDGMLARSIRISLPAEAPTR